MEEVQVDIVVQTITAQYGTLEIGTTLRTNEAFARHLIEDCGAARYSKHAAIPEPLTVVEVLMPDVTVLDGPDVQTSALTDDQVFAPEPAPAGDGVQTSAQIAPVTADSAEPALSQPEAVKPTSRKRKVSTEEKSVG
jgi:hypothetical protein